jgi:hypothetical protein
MIAGDGRRVALSVNSAGGVKNLAISVGDSPTAIFRPGDSNFAAALREARGLQDAYYGVAGPISFPDVGHVLLPNPTSSRLLAASLYDMPDSNVHVLAGAMSTTSGRASLSNALAGVHDGSVSTPLASIVEDLRPDQRALYQTFMARCSGELPVSAEAVGTLARDLAVLH